MKLSQYAKKVGITYRTAWLWYKEGQIKGYQMPTGTIVITQDEERAPSEKVVIYARVSSSEHKSNLETQADRLQAYCAAKGWQVQMVIKEVGSGVNESRDKLLKLLADTSITVIVVEHKDRLTRFGFNYISTLLGSQGRRIEVVNLEAFSKEDLLGDLTGIIYSFCARLYGQRRAKRKTEQITRQLEENENATR
ncbi:IS607 family transposase [Candidatus Poribacteria bacterium]|nr:IS607 family transposase [Candidatus Poribacteria bacterium]